MKDKSLNREKERLRRRLDNSGFVRAIGWNDNENMITGWTSFTVTLPDGLPLPSLSFF